MEKQRNFPLFLSFKIEQKPTENFLSFPVHFVSLKCCKNSKKLERMVEGEIKFNLERISEAEDFLSLPTLFNYLLNFNFNTKKQRKT